MRWTSIVFSACAAWALVLVTFPKEAGAQYLSGRVGYTIPREEDAGLLEDLDLENFVSGAVAYGHELDRGYARFRLEGEISYRQNDTDDARFLGETQDVDGEVRVGALMANVAASIETGTALKPYLMAGGGGAWVDISDAEVDGLEVVDDDRFQFVYQLGGGVELQMGPAAFLDVGYRFISTSKDDFEDRLDEDFLYRYQAHEISLGFRYHF